MEYGSIFIKECNADKTLGTGGVSGLAWTTASGYAETTLPDLGVMNNDCFYCGVKWDLRRNNLPD